MSKTCPIKQLPLLISDDLSIPETVELESHLETCVNCRRTLESLAAADHWWEKTASNLSGHDWQTEQTISFRDSVFVELSEGNTPSAGSDLSRVLLDQPRHPEMLGRLDEFDIEQKIGQGGMGVVYRGFDSVLCRPVAIKLLAPHLASSGVARKRFAREAQAAAAVRHPNVVPIHGVKTSQERPYIVMALVDGRALQDYVQDEGPLEIIDIVRIGHQIASGLAAAHQQGLIHRDIKPGNVLLEKDISQAMITDFGLARAADDVAMTQTGWLAGTPHYMSPEQAKGKDIDQRSDLFSLGSVIYFMATGREPFRADKPLAVLQKIGADQPLPIRSVNTRVPQTLARIVDRLLSKDPADRFQSANDLKDILEKYLAHLQNPGTCSKPKLTKTTIEKRKSRFAIGMVTAFVGLVLASVWMFNQPESPKPAPEAPSDNAVNIVRAPAADNWMAELQSFDEWEQDANALLSDIQSLEQQLQVVPNNETNPVWSEINQLDREMNQLQWNLESVLPSSNLRGKDNED